MTPERRPLTVPGLAERKAMGERIAVLTAYDAVFAAAMESAGVDIILVGDSLGMVIQGHETTLPVTLDQMVYHAGCVARGAPNTMLVVDMPFMSYATPGQALRVSARLMAEGGAHLVKLEGGGRQRVDIVRVLAQQDVPVCAHLGLLPQSVRRLGGYVAQGRDDRSAQQLLEDALLLQEAGAVMLVLECVPASLAGEITAALSIPTIGIGAGADCDGQVLVAYDMLGLTARRPRFCRDFLREGGGIAEAFHRFVAAVREGSFPAPEHAL
ncbi:3-methyl-2-oxobutanoate hydroxymethyltransferase [Methyloparacoccus murrellii]